MNASLECLVWVLRVHEEGGDWKDRSESSIVGVVHRMGVDAVELKAVTKNGTEPLNAADWNAMAEALRNEGIRWVMRLRRNGKVHWIDLSK